jgi:hypothetical protein
MGGFFDVSSGCGSVVYGVHLPDSLTRVGDAVRARKPAVQTVEAPILLIDHDDVLDFLKSSRLGNHSGARQRDRDCTQKRSCEADGQCPMRRTGDREVRDEHVESPWLKLTLVPSTDLPPALSTLDHVVPDAEQLNERQVPTTKSYFGADGIAEE